MDSVAASGFAAGADAYRLSRPSWPLEAVDAAFEHWSIDPGAGLVLDVGAGTGLLTDQLAKRCPQLLAVEPVAEMRRHIRSAPSVDGTAEDLPLADASAQAVFTAEAFHWFDHAGALAELARVLCAGGGLAIMWNHPLPPPEAWPWQEAVKAIIAEHHYHPAGLSLDTRDAREVRDWQSGPQWSQFEPLTYREFAHREEVTREATVARVASFSYIGALDDERRRDVLSRVDAVLSDHGVERYEQRWRCDVYLTRRR